MKIEREPPRPPDAWDRMQEILKHDSSPIYKGTILAEYKKCYKPYCHCMNGGDLHGPYYRLYVPVSGTKTKRKTYLGKDQSGDFEEKFIELRKKHLFGAKSKRQLMGWLGRGSSN